MGTEWNWGIAGEHCCVPVLHPSECHSVPQGVCSVAEPAPSRALLPCPLARPGARRQSLCQPARTPQCSASLPEVPALGSWPPSSPLPQHLSATSLPSQPPNSFSVPSSSGQKPPRPTLPPSLRNQPRTARQTFCLLLLQYSHLHT